jgi:hypothetical protein
MSEEVLMSLDLEIQQLLRSSEVQSINFTMAGIIVSGLGYRELSNCFSRTPMRHRIRVTVRPILVSHDADAEYDDVQDKIYLRSATVLQTPHGRGCVVHELTHAQIDLRATATPIRSEEGAAFIAEAWYYLACGRSVADISAEVSSEIAQIAAAARARAPTGGAVALTADEINTARRAMVARGYGDGHYIADGIRGHRYRGL